MYILRIYEQDKFCAQLSWAWQKFYNLGAWGIHVNSLSTWMYHEDDKVWIMTSQEAGWSGSPLFSKEGSYAHNAII